MSKVLSPLRPDRSMWERLSERGIQSSTLEALERFVGQAADRELYQANPRYWAGRLGLDETTALTLIVAGVAAGLFELNWQTICPVCQHPGPAAQVLGAVAGYQRCAQCGFAYDAHLDDEVFVTVSVSHILRPLSLTQHDDPDFRAALNARYG